MPPKIALTLDKLVQDYPPARQVEPGEIKNAQKETGMNPVLIVLDDDPTGTQSVTDLPVLLAWQPADFRWALGTAAPAIYVMTNSRSLDPAAAAAINVEVVEAALTAAHEQGVELKFVSRSDSTLRGHFPLEPDTLAETLQRHDVETDGYLIVPAFGDAGRITVGGVHYAGNPTGGFIPVGESEFATDKTFGYRSSRLAEWVEEKTAGAVSAADVLVLDLELIRSTPEAIAAALGKAHNRQPIVVDIVEENDLRMLTLGLIAAEAAGKNFIYRVGPPFARARIGQPVASPLSTEQVAAAIPAATSKGGLIVVGSHVPTTTRQLAQLKEAKLADSVELHVPTVLGPAASEYLAGLAATIQDKLQESNVIVHTSRDLVAGRDAEDSLRIAREVSAAVVTVVNTVVRARQPRFVVAKGGITSSDTASKGLEMRHAMVVGPMEPGIISLWASQDGPAAGVPYVVFAGNVGTDDSLANVVAKLSTNN